MTHYDFKKRNDFVYIKLIETVVMNSEQITNKKSYNLFSYRVYSKYSDRQA